MGSEQGVDVLPVREQGGCSDLTKRHLAMTMRLGIVEQRAENVGRVILVGRVGVHLGVALDGVADSGIQLGDGWKFDSGWRNVVDASHLHRSDKLSQVVIWRCAVGAGSITSVRLWCSFSALSGFTKFLGRWS